VPAKRKDLEETLTGSELFIHDASGEQLVVLNATALFAWSLCEDHSVPEMTEVLAEIYPDTPRDRLEHDARSCLAGFLEKGLLLEDP
jgi:hypothetical protein